MRISDWSSDVCSSDLPFVAEHAVVEQRITAPIMYSQERRRAGEGRKRRPRLRKPDMRRETGEGDARLDPPVGVEHRLAKPIEGKAADRKSTRLNSSH